MRLLICAGGTGGGVYPALAVLQALGNRVSSTLWVGGEGGMEADLIQRENIPFVTIPAAGIHGVGLVALPGNLLRLARGFAASRRILRQFKPDVLLFTGGYVAVPMAAAGVRFQSLAFVPDIEPGLALKALIRLADHVAITAEETRDYLPTKPITITGYPTRASLQRAPVQEARTKLGLISAKPVLLVTGGSKGSRAINQAVCENMDAILDLAEVIHITGQGEFEAVQTALSSLSEDKRDHLHLFPYLHDMGLAFTAASLVVSRAGASVLGEYPLFGLPSILVPYPYAWRYQKVNAEYLTRHGAAVIIDNKDLAKNLVPALSSILTDPMRLAAMRQAAADLHTAGAADAIANLLIELAGKGSTHG